MIFKPGVCQASCRLFPNEVPSSTAQFSHDLRRAIGGPFSVMRELCYTVHSATDLSRNPRFMMLRVLQNSHHRVKLSRVMSVAMFLTDPFDYFKR